MPIRESQRIVRIVIFLPKDNYFQAIKPKEFEKKLAESIRIESIRIFDSLVIQIRVPIIQTKEEDFPGKRARL